jgi:hypothetical protein
MHYEDCLWSCTVHSHRPHDWDSMHVWNVGVFTRLYIPEGRNRHTRRRENLKSHRQNEVSNKLLF